MNRMGLPNDFTLAAVEASIRQRRTILALCLGLVVAALAVLPFADRPGPVIPAITTTFGAGVLIADICTGFLLLTQFRVVRSLSLLLLAAAYFYSAAMALMHILTFPGAWIPDAPLLGTPQSVGWLLIFWVLGFPLLVLVAIAAEARFGERSIAANRVGHAVAAAVIAVLAVVGVLAWIALARQAWMPQQLQGNVFVTWGRVAQWISVGLSIIAFVALWLITRGRNVLFGWLGLALLAFAAFNALAVAGGARYTIGWDLSRVSGFISASLLLVFFLGQYAKLHRSLASALAHLYNANENLERRVADRTAKLQASNTQLAQALTERNLLLREVYHRVKNNLQVVDTLLMLQASRLPGAAGTALLDLRPRVNALGLVHQQLMESQDLATFSVAGFLNELCHTLDTAFATADRRITLRVEADPVPVDLDLAIPLGLLITELVSNAVKHAFPAGQGGDITVCFRCASPETAVLTVADNGCGMPDTIPSDTVGRQIIDALVAQMEADMAVVASNGTRVEVSLPFPRRVSC